MKEEVLTKTGCYLFNTKQDGRMPDEFVGTYAVHMIVRTGEVTFQKDKSHFCCSTNDLVVWLISMPIYNVCYSDNFEADFWVADVNFLSRLNTAHRAGSNAFVYVMVNPSLHLSNENLAILNQDFELIRIRQQQTDSVYYKEVLEHVAHIFLYDLWTVYQHCVPMVSADNNSLRIFTDFITLLQQHVRKQRIVAFYADKLCITPKYLSQVCVKVTDTPALQWIKYYSSFELTAMLNDRSLSLADIADEMDFSTIQFFTRYTKQLLGVTPSEFRKDRSKNGHTDNS